MGIFGKSQCKICGSQHRAEVDAMLAEGCGLREVAARFNFSTSSVGRHSLRHAADDVSDDEDAGLKKLIAATERALHRSERRGDSTGTMAALKLLSELRKRRLIRSASGERPQENRDPNALVKQLRSIYGLRPQVQVTVVEHHWTKDSRLVEQLRGLIERRCDSDPVSCALATRLASRILNQRLDSKAENAPAQVEQKEGEQDEHDFENDAELVDEEKETGGDVNEPTTE